MSNNQIVRMIPSVETDELIYLQAFTENLTEDKLQMFITMYNTKRRKTELMLLCSLLGFVGVSGVQRFIVGQLAMGLLYFFTGGLCLIGTIVDIINHKALTFEYNQKMAMETMSMVNA